MRTLLEIVLIGGLAALTWQESLRDRLSDLAGNKPEPRSAPVVQYITRPSATPSGEWMWDPAHQSALDRPAFDSRDPSKRYLDGFGRRYWIDAKGVRHYDQ
jgi:hypothetical protein